MYGSSRLFSDLILLMGTNPLPNYVVAKYFINHNQCLKRIWIFHSEEKASSKQAETREFSRNLKTILKKEYEDFVRGDRIKLIPLSDVSSAKKIITDVEVKFKVMINHEVDFESCHLNYTGGTKAMAVHIYRQLEQIFPENCTFSYLDGRDFKLKDDRYGILTEDLRDEINLNLDVLMKLHGYEQPEGRKKQNSLDWSGTLSQFRDMDLNIMKEMADQGKLKEYLKWVKDFLKANNFKSLEFIEKTRPFFAQSNSLIKTMDKVQESLEREKKENKNFAKELNAPIKAFLQGPWLEVYVYTIVSENINAHAHGKKVPVACNWEIRRIGQEKHFELDVIILNGYQVCGISATIKGKEADCKAKGFEVLHRVNQFGGEEGKAMLVTLMEEEQVRKVAEELKFISGSTDEKLEVLSVEDLPEKILWNKISEHIWGR